MKSPPTVSIIIPTYNRGYIIERAIRSILNQTYQNFEIIIIDDGNDNTKKIIEKFKDKRIRYFHRNKRKGVSSARNFGIKKAKGKYIAFLDSDDEWLPFKLEKQLEILQNSSVNIAFVSSPYIRCFKGVKFLHKCPRKKEDVLKRKFLEIENFPLLQTSLFKKEVFKKIGLFDENLRIYEDSDLFMRIFNSSYDFLIVNKPMTILHVENIDNVTKSKTTPFIENLNYLIEKNKKLFNTYPELLASVYGCIELLLAPISVKKSIMCVFLSVKYDKKIIFNIFFSAWKSFIGGRIIPFINKLIGSILHS